MEAAYTVGVSNRFASLMAEEDDPGDQIISSPNLPEKTDKSVKKKDAKSGGAGGKPTKDNREKAGQQPRKPAQDPGKRKLHHVSLSLSLSLSGHVSFSASDALRASLSRAGPSREV